jgi:hypothetical protein
MFLRTGYFCAQIACSIAVLGSLVPSALATVIPGQEFAFHLTDSYPGRQPQTIFTAELTVGPAIGQNHTFEVTEFSLFNSNGLCITCEFATENLHNLVFNSNSLLLSGDITGSLVGSNPSFYDLRFATTLVTQPGLDLAQSVPTNTWRLSVTNRKTSFGTYSVASVETVDEPPTGALLGLAMIALWVAYRGRATCRFSRSPA